MYYPPVENKLWRHVLLQLEKISRERVVYALLFLLPIFAVTVRHWVSNIFVVLSLLSLVLLYLQRKQKTELLKEEKILLWAFAAYFGVFILTSVVNGWGSLQTRYTGVEIRFLLFIPIYLVVRQMPGCAKWLISGAVLGVLFTAYDGAQAIFFKNLDVYRGVYSPLFTGPIILILASLSLSFFYTKENKMWLKFSLLLMVGLAFFVVSQTGARNAYFAAVILGLLFILHQYKGAKRLSLIVAIFLLAYLSYLFVPTVNDRLNKAYTEFTGYMAYPDPAKFKGRLTSVGTRFEMWRATPIFFKDNPVFGVSRGNYSSEVRTYIRKGLLHPDIGKHGHPHNVYSEAIISKGLLGLISLLFITAYPLLILIRDYRQHARSGFYGIVLITGYMVLSLTDASTLIKGNYTSIYVVFLAVLFSWHIQQKQQRSTE